MHWSFSMTTLSYTMPLRWAQASAVALLALIGAQFVSSPASAADKSTRARAEKVEGGTYRKSADYRRGPQVRGFVQRRGGYSFGAEDTINTTGPGRGLFGSTNAYRNYQVDRQTGGGPFDHGFFFDGGGIAPRGGNSPYIN
jgi:hypothetical protein